MDLVDVFAAPSVPPSDRQWNASHSGDTDPWDSLGEPLVNQAEFIYVEHLLYLWIRIIWIKILSKLYQNTPEF